MAMFDPMSGSLSGQNYENVDPKVLLQLVNRGLLDQDTAMEIMRRKEALAQTQAPMPGGIQAGGTFIASNPLQMAAAALERVQGYRGVNKSNADMMATRGQIAGTNQTLIQALIDALRRRAVNNTVGDIGLAGAQFANLFGAGD